MQEIRHHLFPSYNDSGSSASAPRHSPSAGEDGPDRVEHHHAAAAYHYDNYNNDFDGVGGGDEILGGDDRSAGAGAYPPPRRFGESMRLQPPVLTKDFPDAEDWRAADHYRRSGGDHFYGLDPLPGADVVVLGGAVDGPGGEPPTGSGGEAHDGSFRSARSSPTGSGGEAPQSRHDFRKPSLTTAVDEGERTTTAGELPRGGPPDRAPVGASARLYVCDVISLCR